MPLARLRGTVVPAVECPAGNAELIQRPVHGQVRLLDDADDLGLL